MSRIMVSLLSLNTHIRQSRVNVFSQKDHLRSQDIQTSPTVSNSPMLLPQNQLWLALIHKTGMIMNQVSLTTVQNNEENLTTESWLLEWLNKRGSLRINGQLNGEKMDTWDLQGEIHATFVMMVCFYINEMNKESSLIKRTHELLMKLLIVLYYFRLKNMRLNLTF